MARFWQTARRCRSERPGPGARARSRTGERTGTTPPGLFNARACARKRGMDLDPRNVPRIALILGFAGLLPFLWGVATLWLEPMRSLTADIAGPRFVGPYVLLSYGTVILSFMSGVLW